MEKRKEEMAQQPIGRLLLRYSAPAMIAMMVNSLYNLVDAIFVGQGVGHLALAALAVSFPIQMFILAIAQVVGIGSASIISRSLGAGDQRRAERTAGTSFICVVVLSILLAAVGLGFLRPILRLFGATPAIMPYAVDYLSVILAGNFFFAYAVSSNNLVRAEGNVKVAMYSMFLGAGVNIILDPIFIFGLNMGIRGAAIATVIANMLVFVFLTSYFLSGKSLLKIRRSDLWPDFSVIPEMAGIGASSFTRVAAGSLVAIVLNNSIGFYGDEMHLAILGVCNRLLIFFLMPLFGLVQGFQPILGFNYGARNLDRVRQSIRMATLYATLLTTFAFLLMMLFPTPLLKMFNRDPRLIAEGAFIIRIIVICLPTVGFQVVGATMFQALGRVFPALFLSMSRQILFFIPLVLILPLFFGLPGIWIAIPVSDALAALVTFGWVLLEWKRLERREPAELPFTETVSLPD